MLAGAEVNQGFLSAVELELENLLDKPRLTHSAGVRSTAVQMARRYGVDTEKAALAGLLHDLAKPLTEGDLLKLAGDFDILIDTVDREYPPLLHAPVGAELARRKFGIEDPEVLGAIRWHTTGRQGMSLLEAIIYLADYIEPGRKFTGVQTMRRLEAKSLRAAILYSMDSTIRYLLRSGRSVHPNTLLARNDILRHQGRIP